MPENQNEVVEELVDSNPKGKITLPIKVIIIGCIIGLVFAGIGGIKQIAAKNTNKERKEDAIARSEKMVEQANARLKEIEKEYYPLKDQYEKKQQECDAIVMGSEGWFENQKKCQTSAMEMKSRMNDLEMEDTKIKNSDYTAYYEEVEPMSYIIFYIIGGSIAGLAALGAFIIYLVKGKKTY